jgi:hypothetical protein
MILSRIILLIIFCLCQIVPGLLSRNEAFQDNRLMEDFLNDPITSFDRIKGMNDLCNDIMKYDMDLQSRGYKQTSYIDELFARHFKELEEKRMMIVIYLFQKLRSCNREIIYRTAAAFIHRPQLFANILEGNPDWKGIIDDISRDWLYFSQGLAGLSSTENENTLRNYAISLQAEREQRQRNIEAFLNDPIACFDRIKYLDDICLEIGLYENQRYQEGTPNKFVFDALFNGPFKNLNENSTRIIIHLALHCGGGIQREVLADRVAKSFRAQPQLFVLVLKEYPEWKKVIDLVAVTAWTDFSKGLQELGNSEFEKQIKSYVANIMQRR